MKQTAATACRACQAPLARGASFCPTCGAIVDSRPSWEAVPWWHSSEETSTPPPAYKVGVAVREHYDMVDEDTEDHFQDTQELERLESAAERRRRRFGDDEGGRLGLGPRQMAAIVVIPILVFGVSLLAASMFLRPSTPSIHDTSQRPAAAHSAVPAASHAPSSGAVSSGSATPAATPRPAAPGGQQPTPFQLVPSPVTAVGNFTQGAGGCQGFPGSFYDQFVFTTNNGTLTMKQVSTGDITSGSVQTDGTFSVRAADGSETYTGRITGLTANANYEHHDRSGCKQTYVMSFRFQV